jgi:GNAT superfamily N-acetyltransferase
MPANAEFHRATAEDVPELRNFILAFHVEDGHPIQPHVLERALQAIVQREPLLHVWIITLAARAVGYVALALGYSIEVGGLDAFVDELYVVAEQRGSGVGRRALVFVEQEAVRLGVRRLCLEVENHNTRARALYGEFGYVDHSRHLMAKGL